MWIVPSSGVLALVRVVLVVSPVLRVVRSVDRLFAPVDTSGFGWRVVFVNTPPTVAPSSRGVWTVRWVPLGLRSLPWPGKRVYIPLILITSLMLCVVMDEKGDRKMLVSIFCLHVCPA